MTDGGCLLHDVKWEANLTWKGAAQSNLQFLKSMGNQYLLINVVFEGCDNSTKDHDYLRRTKNACCSILIHPDIKILIP